MQLFAKLSFKVAEGKKFETLNHNGFAHRAG